MTTTKPHLQLSEIGQRVCDIASEQLGIARKKLSLNDRLVEDLSCDSLELVELLMELEEEFQVELPNEPPNSAYKSIFTRQPFRLCHLAELIYLQQGNPPPPQKRLQRTSGKAVEPSTAPFTQLDGHWDRSENRGPLLGLLEVTGQTKIYRRQSDGMRCISVPAALVEIGCNESGPHSDEFPAHCCYLDAFVIDAELVSTTAYCRFLNSVDQVTTADLEAWFVLHSDDHRSEHCLIRRTDAGWRPVIGTEKLPMILVSWFGANAYSLWGMVTTGPNTAMTNLSHPDAFCLAKHNGNTQPEEQVTRNSHGAMMNLRINSWSMACTKEVSHIQLKRFRWPLSMRDEACRPLVYTTWQVTSGSGVVIGMTSVST